MCMLMRCVNEAMRTDPQAQNTRRFEWWLEQVLKDLWADGLVAHLEGANLREQDLRHCVLSETYLHKASLVGTCLEHADLQSARLHGANLSDSQCDRAVFTASQLNDAQCVNARFVRANFEKAHLKAAVLRKAVFRRARLGLADVSEARISDAILAGARGLFGHNRAVASTPIREHESQNAVYHGKWDFLSWERLRVIGGLRLFGVSYLSIAAITLYAAIARQYNTAAESARATALDAQNAGDATVSFWSRVLSELPRIPLPAHLGNQLMATIAVAAAATLYAFACPAEVKEANEVRWTRAMGQPLWEYRSANWSDPWARYISGTLFAAGGGYSIYYLMHRSWNALSYLLFGS